ncbi:MAG: hypothetical protein VB954_11000 [Thalassolituus sp.]
MRVFIFGVLVFFVLYPFKLSFILIESRILVAFAGLLAFLYDLFRVGFSLDRYLFGRFAFVVFGAFLVFWVSALSLIFNESNDIQLLKYPLVVSSFLFMGYFLFFCSRFLLSGDMFYRFSLTLILVVLVQSLISLLMYFYQPLFDVWLNFVVYSEHEVALIDDLRYSRVIGIGRPFFAGGIINGFILIIIAHMLSNYRMTNLETVFYVTSYLLIFLIGMLISRSVLLGFILSVLIILHVRYKWQIRVYLFSMTYLIFLLILILPFLFSDTFEVLRKFAFEMFYSFFDGRGFETRSTEHLKTMFVYPDSVKTWLIGDGYWFNQDGGYYMSTDVGFLRLIYYFGALGLVVFCLYQLTLVLSAFGCSYFAFIVFLYFLVLNLKGYTDLSFIVILFFYFRRSERI